MPAVAVCLAGIPAVAKRENDERYITLYADQQADVRDIATQLNRLKAAFPRNEAVFFNLLAERIVARGMTRSQLTEAVNRLIDGFQYKELNVSDVIGWDKRIKLYSHSEVKDLCALPNPKAEWTDFKVVQVGESYYRVKRSDLARYGLE